MRAYMGWLKKLLDKLFGRKSKVDWDTQRYGKAKPEDDQLDRLNGQL